MFKRELLEQQETDLSPEHIRDAQSRPMEIPPDHAALCCAQCQAPVTDFCYSLNINGRYEYHCVNPAGRYFHVHCFSHAAGCCVEGLATLEDSWFDGHYWQLAICHQCHTHLGWFFRREHKSFFGLIKNRLIACPGRTAH